ncbi:MAG: SipW-dependent-type signal peptide-containing protein [Clostridiales bacterium]|nr:SipW-dependent-type signal peptide-containing protein [Clostridiales bacterium]
MILAIVSFTFLVIVGTAAYLTDQTEVANNTFALGNVKCEILEPAWDDLGEDAIVSSGGVTAAIIDPDRPVAKDPRVKNTGTDDAWIRLKVIIPTFRVTTSDPESGEPLIIEEPLFIIESWNIKETFEYNHETAPQNTVSGHWIKVKTGEYPLNEVYYYYNVKLATGEVTEPLFTEVRLNPKYMEGYFDGDSYRRSIKKGGDYGSEMYDYYFLEDISLYAEAVQLDYDEDGDLIESYGEDDSVVGEAIANVFAKYNIRAVN